MRKTIKTADLSRSNLKATAVSPFGLKKLQPAYENWVQASLADYRNTDPADRCSSLDEYMDDAFYVTGSYAQNNIRHRKYSLGLSFSDTSLEMDGFHYLYMLLTRAVLGGHWNRKSLISRLPLAIVAPDHPEAKYGFSGQTEITNLHWHAIIVGRQQDKAALKAALHDQAILDEVKARTLIDSIDVRLWDPTKKTDYGLKAHAKSASFVHAGLNDLRIYPRPTAAGRLGWGYLHPFSRLRGKVLALRDGIMRDRFADHEYARLHGAEAS